MQKTVNGWNSIAETDKTMVEYPYRGLTIGKEKNIQSEFLMIDEGLCAQSMYIGFFDNEPETVGIMDSFLEEKDGYL